MLPLLDCCSAPTPHILPWPPLPGQATEEFLAWFKEQQRKEQQPAEGAGEAPDGKPAPSGADAMSAAADAALGRVMELISQRPPVASSNGGGVEAASAAAAADTFLSGLSGGGASEAGARDRDRDGADRKRQREAEREAERETERERQRQRREEARRAEAEERAYREAVRQWEEHERWVAGRLGSLEPCQHSHELSCVRMLACCGDVCLRLRLQLSCEGGRRCWVTGMLLCAAGGNV